MIFILLLFLFATLSASPFDPYIPLSDTDRGLPTLAAGCVNVISGDYVESHTDISVPGPIPLTFDRFYSSGSYKSRSLFQGWHHNHDSHLEIHEVTIPVENEESKKIKQAYLIERSGRSGIYSDTDGGYRLDSSKNEGITNCQSGIISGRMNIHNNVILKSDDNYKVHASNGSSLRYLKDIDNNHKLVQERFLNQNKLKYTYMSDGLKTIQTANKDDVPFSTLIFHHRLNENPHCIITSDDGRSVTYSLEKYKNRTKHEKNQGESRYYHIKEVNRSDAPPIKYEYKKIEAIEDELLTLRSFPEGRNLWIGYNKSQKVCSLKSPVGPDATPILTHYIHYYKDPGTYFNKPLEGATVVKSIFGNATLYTYDKNKRLCNLIKYVRKTQQEGPISSSYAVAMSKIKIDSKALKMHTNERFIWDSKGQLRCQRLDDSLGNTLVAKTFSYDHYGNIIKENVFGNITGKTGMVPKKDHLPDKKKGEYYERKFTYDKKHLLVHEVEANGKSTSYGYHEGTDLLRYTLIKDRHAIKIRKFFHYDSNAVLIKTICDNGSSTHQDNLTDVTERKITTIEPVYPWGLPGVIQESYLDNGVEKLLNRKVNHYSPQGRLIQQDVYDSENAFRYSLFWEYDAHGNAIRETDPLGQVTIKAYDANDNQTYELRTYTKKFTYDFSNRLIREEIDSFSTSYCYDVANNKISSTDYNGNKTNFSYDDFGKETKAIFPPIPTPEGSLFHPSTEKKYTLLGHIAYQKDQRGNGTYARYNILGKPIRLDYPDGTQERFTYSSDGNLIEQVERNNIVTLYDYDSLGRIINEQRNSSHNSLHRNNFTSQQKTYEYDGFHLIRSIDPLGLITTYHYDGAGRLVEEIVGDSRTTYEYDTLSRLHKTKSWSDETHFSVKVQEYDLLDRLIEERLEDEFGNIQEYQKWGYDADNNCIFTQNGDTIIHTTYNALKQPLLITDGEGNQTHYSYEYGHLDDYGIPVLQVIETDPLGVQTITTMNALNKPAKIIKRDPFDQQISQRELFYDGVGNLIQCSETVFPQMRKVTTKWEYDAYNNLKRVIEADQKTTTYEYKNGQLDKVTKPDGTTLQHTYDNLGRLSHLHSSDNSISETYAYNLNDLPTAITDHVSKTTTKRTYDAQNRMVEEVLGNGIPLGYAYDRQGRVTCVTLPDQSQIRYHYEGHHLTQVDRLSSSSAFLYSHRYTSYDGQGHLLSATLAGKGGIIDYSYDLLGRLQSMTHEHLTSQYRYDPVGNLTSTYINGVEKRFTYDYLNQLTSETEHEYHYDSAYNRLQKGDHPYLVNDLNQVLHESNHEYTYDLNGNLIQCDDTHYAYDALDRLISVTQGDKVTTYRYDPFHRRLSKTSNASTIHYLYQGQNEIGAYDPATKEITELRILGNGLGAEIGASIALEINKNAYIPLYDQVGSIVTLLDLEGQVQERLNYTAFGESAPSSLTPWTYLSKRFDPETNWIYFGRRYYLPRIGKWTTADPAGVIDGINLYAYLKNNPLVKVDLFGLFEELLHTETDSVMPTYEAFTNPLASKFYAQYYPYLFGGPIYFAIGLSRSSLSLSSGSTTDNYQPPPPPVAIEEAERSLEECFTSACLSFAESPGEYGKQWGISTGTFLTEAALTGTALKCLGVVWEWGSGACKGALCAINLMKKEASLINVAKEGAQLAKHNPCTKIAQLEGKVSTWLGEEAKMIKNKAGDPVFISEDGMRRVRFDFKNPHGDRPHMHIEKKMNSRWTDETNQHRIYPYQ